MLVVQTVDSIEIVSDQEYYQDPFQATWGLHTEDDHKDNELREEQGLQYRVVAE